VAADTPGPGWALRCDAEHAGLDGCQAPVCWVIRAASATLGACGRHLNKVCLQMTRTGVQYMTVSIVA
jgi:hypothetical protein